MRLSSKITLLAASVLALAGLSSCKTEEPTESMAVMTSTSSLSFAAKEAPEVTISVYADANWSVECPEWISVDPMSGTGCMDITVSVTDNMRDGAIDNPRKGHIYVTGCNLDIRGDVTVVQDGDRYRDVAPVDVAGALALKEEDVIILSSSQVVAVTSKGFILNDGTGTILAICDSDVRVGDMVTLKGDRTNEYKLAAIRNVSDVETSTNSAVNYPEPLDISAGIDNYTSEARDYVTVQGLLDGNKVIVDGAEVISASILNPAAGINVSELDGHTVKVTGYFAGLAKPVLYINPVAIEDLGGNGVSILLNDNLEWLAKWAQASSAGDFISTGESGASAPCVYTVETLSDAFLSDLAAHGYEDINPAGKVLYIQGVKDAAGNYTGGYFKMCKTSVNTGLKLPQIKVDKPTDVTVTIKWAAHYGGTFKVDQTKPMITLEGDGVIVGGADDKNTEPFVSAQTHYDADGNILEDPSVAGASADHFWNEISFTVKGMTKDSRLSMYPSDYENAATNKYQRWHFGGIRIEAGEAGGSDEPDSNPGVLRCKWQFSADDMGAYQTTFKTAGTDSREAGDGGQYVANNLTDETTKGSGTISYFSVDKTAIDLDSKFTRMIGSTGHPYVTGAWPGDYWLFKMTNGKKFAAGTQLHIKFITRISGTGQKYWLLEAWDGEKWIPTEPLKKVTVEGQGEIEYNFEPTTASSNTVVDYTWTLAKTCSIMQFRYTCKADFSAGGAPLTKPNGGTSRIAGDAEGTSPVFEVL